MFEPTFSEARRVGTFGKLSVKAPRTPCEPRSGELRNRFEFFEKRSQTAKSKTFRVDFEQNPEVSRLFHLQGGKKVVISPRQVIETIFVEISLKTCNSFT